MNYLKFIKKKSVYTETKAKRMKPYTKVTSHALFNRVHVSSANAFTEQV